MNERTAVGRPPAATEAPGALLAAARLRRGLSIADIARQTKLSPAQIEAIEAGDHAKLPLVIVRGFIRNYARLLQIDPAPLLRSPELARPSPAKTAALPDPQTLFPSRNGKTRTLLLVGVVALLLVPVLLAFIYRDTPAIVAAGKFMRVQPAPPLQETFKRELPLPAAAAPIAEKIALTAAGRERQDAAAPTVPAAPASPDGEIRLIFNKESWVEIKDRNALTIFSQHNRKGSEQSVKGAPPLSLVIGNADAVRVLYNGTPIDLPHRASGVARLSVP